MSTRIFLALNGERFEALLIRDGDQDRLSPVADPFWVVHRDGATCGSMPVIEGETDADTLRRLGEFVDGPSEWDRQQPRIADPRILYRLDQAGGFPATRGRRGVYSVSVTVAYPIGAPNGAVQPAITHGTSVGEILADSPEAAVLAILKKPIELRIQADRLPADGRVEIAIAATPRWTP